MHRSKGHKAHNMVVRSIRQHAFHCCTAAAVVNARRSRVEGGEGSTVSAPLGSQVGLEEQQVPEVEEGHRDAARQQSCMHSHRHSLFSICIEVCLAAAAASAIPPPPPAAAAAAAAPGDHPPQGCHGARWHDLAGASVALPHHPRQQAAHSCGGSRYTGGGGGGGAGTREQASKAGTARGHPPARRCNAAHAPPSAES